ncbi:MAG: hypothetical protein B6D77_06000 [gamma proteobacterium symbiont of Ctena orbiculata]|nr:MAG: hypothetical protein B6D77_06000 [gamma proteobacterium symbiont of Ctena orbiculata]PVV19416.1 MAG: hypothetical protein B6D79_15235 [gamma proteobacterium symbiont of Ctena orbiculata]PVV25324.1 MAG: hypothetical protein B6D78_00455 [gamma proteobacterium symbiont of Ctena orbiculata]
MATSNKIRSLFLLLLLSYAPLALSHGVGLAMARQEAQVIWLRHDDDTPLADADYELSVVGANTPYQTGQTDALGRVVFIPGDLLQWRLRVFSEDGHGVDKTFELTAAGAIHSHDDHGYSHITKLILGIGILLSVFGVVMLFVKRNKH